MAKPTLMDMKMGTSRYAFLILRILWRKLGVHFVCLAEFHSLSSVLAHFQSESLAKASFYSHCELKKGIDLPTAECHFELPLCGLHGPFWSAFQKIICFLCTFLTFCRLLALWKNSFVIRISVDPLTNPEKRAAMDLKDKKTTTCSLGMRVCGVNIQNIADGTVFKQGKPWGKAITVEQMPGAVKQFFHDGKKLRLDVAAHFLEDVQRILAWWTKQSVFCLYSSSLLFVFDASVENSVKAQIRVIDYAHPIDITDGSHDEGMIFGLQNLVKHLEDLIAGK